MRIDTKSVHDIIESVMCNCCVVDRDIAHCHLDEQDELIAQQSQELEAANKRIAELEGEAKTSDVDWLNSIADWVQDEHSECTHVVAELKEWAESINND